MAHSRCANFAARPRSRRSSSPRSASVSPLAPRCSAGRAPFCSIRFPVHRARTDIMALESTTPSGSWTPVSWLDYRDFRKYLRSFDDLAAAYPIALALGDELHPERLRAELVSANFFDVLRVRPALGRFFSAPRADDAPGSQPLAIISHSLWQRRWHGDSAVIGQVVDVNRFPFTDRRHRAEGLSRLDARRGCSAVGAGDDGRSDHADGQLAAARSRLAHVPRARARCPMDEHTNPRPTKFGASART